jgi:hypothetical protein
MRPGSSDAQIILPFDATELLAKLWRRIRVDSRQTEPERLRDVARQISLMAHEAGMRPEELIIAVKGRWTACGTPRGSGERQRLDSALADLISLCIDEFYLTRSDTARRRRVE